MYTKMEQLVNRATYVFNLVASRPDLEQRHPWFINIVNKQKQELTLMLEYRDKHPMYDFTAGITIMNRELDKIEKTFRSGLLR